jgi:hypothetical protein
VLDAYKLQVLKWCHLSLVESWVNGGSKKVEETTEGDALDLGLEREHCGGALSGFDDECRF